MSRREFENIISEKFGQNVRATTEKGLHTIQLMGMKFTTRENQNTIDCRWHGRQFIGGFANA